MKPFSIKKIALLAFLTGAVLAIQLIPIRRPYLGHFSSYQIVSASMARNMVRENFSQLLLPKTDLMIGKKKSMPLNQYPFHSLFAAVGSRVFGGGLEFWGRFQAIFFNLLSIALMGLIATSIFTSAVGWITVALASLSPFSLIYGQTFMSEASALFFMLLSVYLLLPKSQNAPAGLFGVMTAGLAFSIAITSRVHFLLFLPVFCAYIFCLGPKKRRQTPASILFSLFALALPLAWYVYTYFISIHADNIHTNLFMQLGGRKLGDDQFLKSLDYYRLVFDIFVQKMLTPLVFPFFVIGLCLFDRKPDANRSGRWLVLGGCFFGALIVFLFPQKVMAHEFYLYGAFPFVLMVAAYGIAKILEAYPSLSKVGTVSFLLVLYLAVSSRSFLHPIYKYPEEDKKLLSMSTIVKHETQPTDWIIVVGRGFSALNYYAERPSWSIDLNAIGEPMAQYLKDTRFSGINIEQVSALERAMKSPIDWLEYLRAQGASYLIAPKPKDLEDSPQFLSYIEKNYRKVPSAENLFFYSLANTSKDTLPVESQRTNHP